MMSQGRNKYIKEPESLHFALLGVHSRDLSRRKHNVDLACNRCNELAGNRQSEVLKQHLPVILRLASVCPFEDVRRGFTKLLQNLKVSWNRNSKLACRRSDNSATGRVKIDIIDFRRIYFDFLFRHAAKKSREKFTWDLRLSSRQKRYVKLWKRAKSVFTISMKLISTFRNIFVLCQRNICRAKNRVNLIFWLSERFGDILERHCSNDKRFFAVVQCLLWI